MFAHSGYDRDFFLKHFDPKAMDGITAHFRQQLKATVLTPKLTDDQIDRLLTRSFEDLYPTGLIPFDNDPEVFRLRSEWRVAAAAYHAWEHNHVFDTAEDVFRTPQSKEDLQRFINLLAAIAFPDETPYPWEFATKIGEAQRFADDLLAKSGGK